jgi:hypothetical protein
MANQQLEDEIAIIRVVDAIDNAVDDKDWETCRGYFTDQFHADFTSLVGGEPADIPADALIQAWKTSLYEDKKSFHMRSNYRVTITGDTAEVFSKGYALNILAVGRGSDLWEVWGNYVHTLTRTADGWKCSGMTLTVVYARGNEKVREFLPNAK